MVGDSSGHSVRQFGCCELLFKFGAYSWVVPSALTVGCKVKGGRLSLNVCLPRRVSCEVFRSAPAVESREISYGGDGPVGERELLQFAPCSRKACVRVCVTVCVSDCVGS